jgi:hypothetical protein
MYKLERFLIVFNSPKTVGMHLLSNFIPITSIIALVENGSYSRRYGRRRAHVTLT